MSSLYPAKKRAPETYTTEFDILKAAHKFLRTEEDAKSWDAQLAKKYEDNLFKEFAVCNLKHYKSGNIALRWRTENEVLSGAGETTCGNTRCPYHNPLPESGPSGSQGAPPRPPKLTTMELPFSYVENGETEIREVMVKVILCERCVKKLMWKREKEKEKRERLGPSDSRERYPDKRSADAGTKLTNSSSRRDSGRSHDEKGNREHQVERRSRSRSPQRHSEYNHGHRKR